MSVIGALNITKNFYDGSQTVAVLRGSSLVVEPGEVVALEGPSGSGKTTFISILGCMLTPTSGQVEIDGVAVDSQQLSSIRRRLIGFVFQQFNLFPALSALENVEFALNIRGYQGNMARRQAQAALDAVGLSDHAACLPRDLSGGEKQRVAIARALSGDSALVLADEPTANLDSETGGLILALFRALAKKERKALVIVTHDPKVRRIADRVAVIRDGRIVSATEQE